MMRFDVGVGVEIVGMVDGNGCGLLWSLVDDKFNVQLSIRKSIIKRFWMATEFKIPVTAKCDRDFFFFLKQEKREEKKNIRQKKQIIQWCRKMNRNYKT